MPVTTYSAHWIANAAFRTAIANYLDSEREHVAETVEALAEFGPYRKDGNPE